MSTTESGHIKTVERQEGNEVLVSVPMVGFPTGYQLKTGDKVTLEVDENGPAVRPLVHVKEVEGGGLESASLFGEGGPFTTQKSTVLEGVDDGSQRMEVYVVDSDSDDTEDVIAVRPVE